MTMRHHYVYYSYEEYGRGYIGSRSCKSSPDKDTNYYGSFTDSTFNPTQKIILSVFDTAEESLEAEHILMEFYDVSHNPHFVNRQISPHRYGVCKGQRNGMYGRKHTEESKKIMSEKRRDRKISDETRRRMSESQKGKKRNSGESISRALKGRVFTPEWKSKLSVAASKPTGRKMTYEQKKKMYEARWGRPYEEMLKESKDK